MRFKKVIFLLSFLFAGFESMATHIRAGEVIARRVDNVSLTYVFTFFGYRDQEGVQFGQGRFDFGDGDIYGDDPNEPIPWENITDLGNGVERWEFSISHIYQAPNNYLVSYTEDFRNDAIQNIAGSINTSFYVETLIVIDPLIGENNTPFFTVPPIDQGVVGFTFEHNPGAFDLDGDSLSYFFTTPKKAKGQDVDGYRTLVDPSFYENFSTGNQTKDGPPTLTLDEFGTMIWNAPGGVNIPDMENREFNVAFVVEEWRKINGEWIKLGFVTRDMQIIIWNFDNEPPEIELPPDTCVIAGDPVIALITGTDPDGDPVKLEAFGGPFEVNAPVATFSPDPPEFQGPPSVLTFEWQTVCGHIRANPYNVQFKATDQPTIMDIQDPPGAVNFETWQITVVGPAPTGLLADSQDGRAIQLSWDDYSCPNADSIQVWRRVGEFEIDPNCNPGIPENSGYELIESLDISETALLDDNNGIGLSPGSKYCYRLVATFPGSTGGLSVASAEACDSLAIDVPLITNVDIMSTSETNGEIMVNWTPPYEIDVTEFPPNYSYTVLRTVGKGPGGNYTPVFTNQTDTFFVDSGLNTEDLFYAYKVVLFANNGNPIDTSAVASSVRLIPTPQVGAIRLNWDANTPWSLSVQEFPYHYVYRDNVLDNFLDSLVLVDSVEVTLDGLAYLDDGSFNGINLREEIEYCYFVSTQGSYGNELVAAPLINRTQIICAQPNDTIPPCTPIAFTFDSSGPFSCENNNLTMGCDFNDFQNRLVWDADGELDCGDDIQRYRIYFSRNGNDEFVLLAETQETSFIHDGLSSYVGCYKISAVDRSGNESVQSEIFCNDNCPQFVMPNVFTPNNDGKNDLLRPFYSGNLIGKNIQNFSNTDCPRFVRSVIFNVFNRAGAPIFTYDSSENENSFLINWDGTTNGGKDLPEGAYYYSAEVTFDRLNPEDAVVVYTGWVQILR
ncbi:MAG: gliding motility-associated C-terminal domain-containing protein [Cyclobacteriaceae bacterium]